MGNGVTRPSQEAIKPRGSTQTPRKSGQKKVSGSGSGGTPATDKDGKTKQPFWFQASKSDEQFEKYLQTVFKRADQDNSGYLDKEELHRVLFSPKLGLNLTEKEAEDVILEYDVSHDGMIDYQEFSAMLRHLLKLVQSKVEDPVNDWACIEDPDGKTVIYLNKRTGKTQKARPMTFNPERVEYVTTRHVTVADGSTVTVRSNEDGKEEYIDFETGEWRPFNPANFQPPAPLEYKGLPITFEVGDAWKAYAEDLTNPPFQKYRVPLMSLLDVDTNLKALCEDLSVDFPDLKDNMQMLAIAATISGYEYDTAKEFITSNNLSSVKSLSANEAEDEKLSFEKISELEKSNAELTKKNHLLSDELADVKAQASKLQDQNRMLEERCEKLQRWQAKDKRSSTVADKGHNGVHKAEQAEIKQLKEDRAALEKEVESLKKEVQALHDLERTKAEAAAAATQAASGQAAEQATAAAAAEHAAAIAALRAEVEAMKSRNESLKTEKETAEAETRAMAAKVDQSAGVTKQIASKMRELMKEVRNTRAAVVATKEDVAGLVSTVKPMLKDAITEVRSLKDKTHEITSVVTQKYLKESALRKRYYNQIQELKGNIRVFVRVRKDNRGTYKGAGVFNITSDTEALVQNIDPDKKPLKFEFAKIYGPTSTQDQVFADTKDTMMSVVDGYNVCIMAYGQTGSGKTFTMMGPEDNPGVNRRAIRELLDRLRICKADGDIDYLLEASQLEVYNEHIYDLLNMGKREETKIKPRAIGKKVDLPGLTWRKVANLQDVEKVMLDGDANRSVAATAMNTESSRSHLLLQLRVTITNTVTRKQTASVLTLVDLAGSERVSKSEAAGNTLVEAAAINKSLSSLGQVFLALSKGDPHVPYRNSALTTVLKESLGGHAKCCMFANTSPLDSNLGETISTLKFARTITSVELGHAKSNRTK
eukprot:m.175586 g.175586  ORF g.175586 m.175586 type:complete len:935 (-) comp14023_c0_seq1:255-3059(-)